MRRELAERVPRAVLRSASGLDDAVSWALRDKLVARHPRDVIRSLGSLPSGDRRAAKLRAMLHGEAPEEVASSLTGLDDEEAWRLRERLIDAAPDAVVASLRGIDTEQAWDLRQSWLDRVGDRVQDDYEVARRAAKSVGGLPGERAWQWRDLARSAAPVAALGSIYGLTDERAWSERAVYLQRAPKAIMASIGGLADPRAWQMRRAVIDVCKEALDSMSKLDGDDAWSLRDGYADVWPSTVIKTLGPLSTTPRGMALIARQLRLYPDDISLLKNAAAVELGIARTLPLENAS
jgi:dTMP kinase